MGSDDEGIADDVPDLGPPPQRVEVDPGTVRRLVAEQFPEWSHLPVTPVLNGGWDNYTFHLGDDMLVRLPSAAEYALAVDKERRWLPALATHVTVPIPSVCGHGVPSAEYPFAWSIYRWLDGDPATFAGIADSERFAEDLADFLVSLRRISAAEGPRPGIHNWFRGATLRTYHATLRRSLEALAGQVDADRSLEIWSEALNAPWDGVDVWFHGDLAEGNLLLRNGQLGSVIDVGTCGVGDPSCDLAIAWTLLTEPARQVFRDRLYVDDASWARGRGWALWKTLAGLAGAEDEEEAAPLMRVLGELTDRDHRS